MSQVYLSSYFNCNQQNFQYKTNVTDTKHRLDINYNNELSLIIVIDKNKRGN